jgi:hypothetical protein
MALLSGEKKESIKEILIRRDGVTSGDADKIIENAKNTLQEYLAEGDLDSADYICEEFFGLEADYLPELLT